MDNEKAILKNRFAKMQSEFDVENKGFDKKLKDFELKVAEHAFYKCSENSKGLLLLRRLQKYSVIFKFIEELVSKEKDQMIEHYEYGSTLIKKIVRRIQDLEDSHFEFFDSLDKANPVIEMGLKQRSQFLNVLTTAISYLGEFKSDLIFIQAIYSTANTEKVQLKEEELAEKMFGKTNSEVFPEDTKVSEADVRNGETAEEPQQNEADDRE